MLADFEKHPFASQVFWNRYWHDNCLAACLVDNTTGNYRAIVRTAWEQFFTRCEDRSKLLDIGTGNGAVPLIALETSLGEGKTLEIHGIDRANIDPARYVPAAKSSLKRIQFHAETLAESLPFPDAYFDLLTGQYALEYTDAKKSVPELCRVAKSHAQMRFVLHARGAAPVASAEAGLSDITYALDSVRLVNKARDMIRAAFAFEYAGRYSSMLNAEAHDAREVYRVAARAVDQRYTRSDDKRILGEMLFGIREIWDHRREYPVDRALKLVDLIEMEVREHYSRNAAMCAAALSRSDVERLAQEFLKAGVQSVSVREFTGLDRGSFLFLGWEMLVR